jgi:ATP-binding cassette subfamily A (ABC1) protein 3
MGDGRIRCLGSPFFLKTKYGMRTIRINMINFVFFVGVGYHLILSKDTNSDPNQIFQLVHKHVELAKLESAIGAECKILLPHGSSTKFPVLFEDLERHKDALQIFSIGLSETSIEEVFMKMYKKTNSF